MDGGMIGPITPDAATTAADQSLHPYFDHDIFVSEQWLYAKINRTSPATISFFPEPPSHWDSLCKERVITHFSEYNLASRYTVEAGSELVMLTYLLNEYRNSIGKDAVKQHLEMQANSQTQLHINSWQTAMYQALANSTWYCESGAGY